MSEERSCPILKPMADWIQIEESKIQCKPCLLGPVAQWYRDELVEKGHLDKANELEEMADSIDMDSTEQVLTFCRALDNIKATVEEPLRERLKDFDCAAQSYDPDAAAEDEQQQNS
jgi:hypothetical protein